MRQSDRKITRLTIAIANRNNADAAVPINPPISLNASRRSPSSGVAAARPATTSATTAEWPRAKNRPTVTDRRPACISLRVTLSIAAM